jgi:hypothetical protein
VELDEVRLKAISILHFSVGEQVPEPHSKLTDERNLAE